MAQDSKTVKRKKTIENKGLWIREYILKLCRRDLVTGCLLWQGEVDRDGYPHAWVPFTFTQQRIARLLWKLEKGGCLKGLELRHLCGVHNCVNLDHMYPIEQYRSPEPRKRRGKPKTLQEQRRRNFEKWRLSLLEPQSPPLKED
jgi:hypothetical protein